MVKSLSEWSRLRRAKYRVRVRLPGGGKARRKLAWAEAQDVFNRAVATSAGKVCVDLGANVGHVTRQMAAVAGQVYAFEPDPWAVEQLRRNVSRLDNVTVIAAAAAAGSAGTVPFYRKPDFASDPAALSVSGSVLALNGNLDTARPLQVEQVDFVRWLEELAGDVWLLKMDIEGAEVALLEALFARPALLDRLGYIFAETHERFLTSHRQRVGALRAQAGRMKRPVVNLDWH